MDDLKTKTASGEYKIVDNKSLKAKMDFREKSGAGLTFSVGLVLVKRFFLSN